MSPAVQGVAPERTDPSDRAPRSPCVSKDDIHVLERCDEAIEPAKHCARLWKLLGKLVELHVNKVIPEAADLAHGLMRPGIRTKRTATTGELRKKKPLRLWR